MVLDEMAESPLGYLAAGFLPLLVPLWRGQPTGLLNNLRY